MVSTQPLSETLRLVEKYLVMKDIVKFEYNGSPISFLNGDKKMVNATEMGKPFGESKKPKEWLSNKSTKDFLDVLSSERGIPPSQLVVIRKGNSSDFEQGTWMHEDVAIEYARWLSPKFAIWCNDRIKELAKYGITATQTAIDNIIANPAFGIQLLTALQAERAEKARLAEENRKQLEIISEKDEKIDEQTKQIEIMEKKVSYLDTILASKDTVTITQIAQDYGKSAVTFNQILKDNGVQYKVNDQWILYADYKDRGYVQSHTVEYNDKQGNTHTKLNTRWTQKGRVFLYEFLKKIGILPKIEQ